MSITAAMYSGVSGLLANAEGINVIGNNLANVNTIGFKGSRMLFSDLLSANIGNNSQIGRGTQIQKVDNLFGQGSFEITGNASDVAIQGAGFFRLQAPVGANTYLTRAGAFRLDSAGNLVNPDGYFVLDDAGAKITLTNPAKITSIDSTGTITYVDTNNVTQVYGSKIDVVTVPNVNALQKAGGTLFDEAASIAAGSGPIVNAAADGTINRIVSNNLELSNVDMATEFVKMITTQRAYSANSKTITTADEMTQEVLNLKR
jgi:flagellar hook protein FlgE